jgi:uncharacterized membrane protein YfcA
MTGLEIIFAYCLLGVFAGTMAGLLGVGGGLIIVPALIAIWQPESIGGIYAMQLAIGTSLATIVLTSVASVRAHHQRGSVQWNTVWRLTPGIVLGAWLGAALATQMSGESLKSIFGVFELLVAAQMAFGLRPAPHRGLPGQAGMTLVGSGIGAVSAIIGIGGGTMTVPFLTWCNVTIHKAVGTSAACGLPIAIGGAISYLLLGWDNVALPSWSAGFIYGPALAGIAVTSMLFAPLGAALAHRLSTVVLKRSFAGFLALLGIWMLTV